MSVKSSTVSQWKIGKRQVPWERMRALVNAKMIRWDWLLEGIDEKFRQTTDIRHHLGRTAITRRFVSMLPTTSGARLAGIFGVSQVTAHRIVAGKMHVPWEMLWHVK